MRAYQVDNLIAITASFLIVLTITLIVVRAWRRAFEAQHELRRQLIDRIAPEELARMLESPDRARVIAALTGSGEASGASGAIGRGLMLLLIGAALGVSAATSHLPLVGIAGMVAFAAGLAQLIVGALMKRERERHS